MLYYLSELETSFGPLRLFKYLSFRCALAISISFLVGFFLAPYMIKIFKNIKLNQSFRTKEEVGKLADLHSVKKNTPTMGGLIIFISVMFTSLFAAKLNTLVFTALFVYTAFTGLGFLDDYLKVVKKNSKGVSGRLKLTVQILTTFVALALLYFSTDYSFITKELWIPFMKYPLFEHMPIWITLIFMFLIIGGSSNAINLTDGVDGLAIGCTITVAIAYAIFAYITGNSIMSEYLFIQKIDGAGELAVVCCAIFGAGLAFLWYNAYPAEVFMGDTGSLALGGIIGVIAFMICQPITLVIAGGIFVMEAMSVIIQVGYFKTTKKRVFLMSPIHHHFELKGWHENKLVIRFWIMSLIFALIAIATLKLR